jgi:hypothetical protein
LDMVFRPSTKDRHLFTICSFAWNYVVSRAWVAIFSVQRRSLRASENNTGGCLLFYGVRVHVISLGTRGLKKALDSQISSV